MRRAGPTFYPLHLLFDKHYDEQNALVDTIAERIYATDGYEVEACFSNFWPSFSECATCLEARRVQRKGVRALTAPPAASLSMIGYGYESDSLNRASR